LIEKNNNLEMNNRENNKRLDNISLRIKNNEDHSTENHNYVALNNNIDMEIKRANFNDNETQLQDNLFDYFNLTKEQINNLKIKIFSNGKRILMKGALILWITYFLIIFISLLFFIFV